MLVHEWINSCSGTDAILEVDILLHLRLILSIEMFLSYLDLSMIVDDVSEKNVHDKLQGTY